MELLPSWEQMEDGGWMAWRRYNGNKGRGRQEEETGECKSGGGGDGVSMSETDKAAEQQEGLQHTGLH